MNRKRRMPLYEFKNFAFVALSRSSLFFRTTKQQHETNSEKTNMESSTSRVDSTSTTKQLLASSSVNNKKQSSVDGNSTVNKLTKMEPTEKKANNIKSVHEKQKKAPTIQEAATSSHAESSSIGKKAYRYKIKTFTRFSSLGVFSTLLRCTLMKPLKKSSAIQLVFSLERVQTTQKQAR